MRPFNIVASFASLLPMIGELGWLIIDTSFFGSYLIIVSCLCVAEYILLAILLERGAKRWIM